MRKGNTEFGETLNHKPSQYALFIFFSRKRRKQYSSMVVLQGFQAFGREFNHGAPGASLKPRFWKASSTYVLYFLVSWSVRLCSAGPRPPLRHCSLGPPHLPCHSIAGTPSVLSILAAFLVPRHLITPHCGVLGLCQRVRWGCCTKSGVTLALPGLLPSCFLAISFSSPLPFILPWHLRNLPPRHLKHLPLL